jgi:NAD-dependent DNA ligase
MQEITKMLQELPVGSFDLSLVVDLQDVLAYHSDLYYNKNDSVISDKEYDELLNKLHSAEKLLKKEMKKA